MSKQNSILNALKRLDCMCSEDIVNTMQKIKDA